MTPTHLVAVTQWVNWVAQATGMPSGADPDGIIKTRAVMLGEKYPDTRVFTQASATFVAIECGLMALPAIGILDKFLEKWWVKNKLTQPAIAGPGSAELEASGLPSEDRANVAIWLKHHAAGDLTDRELTMRLSVLRKVAPAGYHWLLNARLDASMRAAEIAVKQRWMEAEHRWTPPTDDEKQEVAAIVRGVHRGVAEPWQATDMRADDGIVKVASPESPPPPAKPLGALTPEQLHAVRMNNPALRALAEKQATDAKVPPEPPPPPAPAPAPEPEPVDDWKPSYLRLVPT